MWRLCKDTLEPPIFLFVYSTTEIGHSLNVYCSRRVLYQTVQHDEIEDYFNVKSSMSLYVFRVKLTCN